MKKKDSKFNPVVITEGVVLGAIIVIGLLNSLVLAVFNWVHHHG
jgi:hypothetical protein